jgi:hypothetical protein
MEKYVLSCRLVEYTLIHCYINIFWQAFCKIFILLQFYNWLLQGAFIVDLCSVCIFDKCTKYCVLEENRHYKWSGLL